MKTKEVLLQRAQQIATSADIAAEATNDWLTIKAVMTRRAEDLQLNERQEAKLKRYQFIYNQLVSGKYTEEEVRELVETTYGISYVQARNDMRDARELFSTAVNVNKAFEMKVHLEQVKKWTQMAIAKGDLRAAAQFDKNRVKLESLLQDAEDNAAEDFTPHTYVITFDPALLGLKPLDPKDVEQLRKDIIAQYGGKLDIGFMDAVEAEEISFEEVPDER